MNISIQGAFLFRKIKSSKKVAITAAKFALSDDPFEKLYDIVPRDSLISSSDAIIYEFDEKSGRITKLKSEYYILSDENYLNSSIGEGNRQFDKLLEIEEEL